MSVGNMLERERRCTGRAPLSSSLLFSCRPGRPRRKKRIQRWPAGSHKCLLVRSLCVSCFCLSQCRTETQYTSPRLHFPNRPPLPFCHPQCRMAGALGRRPYAGTVGMLCAFVFVHCDCAFVHRHSMYPDTLRTLRILYCAHALVHVWMYFWAPMFS